MVLRAVILGYKFVGLKSSNSLNQLIIKNLNTMKKRNLLPTTSFTGMKALAFTLCFFVSSSTLLLSQQSGFKIVAEDGAHNDYIGHSVSLDGDYALIGARYDDVNGIRSGSAYVYSNSCNVRVIVDAEPGTVVYMGYAPMECTDLAASPTDRTPPYTYEWIANGVVIGTSEVISVCPEAAI